MFEANSDSLTTRVGEPVASKGHSWRDSEFGPDGKTNAFDLHRRVAKKTSLARVARSREP